MFSTLHVWLEISKTNSFDSDESLDVDPNYDPSDFLKLPGTRQDNHDMGMVKQELHQEIQQYDLQQEELQQHEYEHQEYQQQDYQQIDSVNIEVIAACIVIVFDFLRRRYATLAPVGAKHCFLL